MTFEFVCRVGTSAHPTRGMPNHKFKCRTLLERLSKLMFVVPALAGKPDSFRLKAVPQTLKTGFEMPSNYHRIHNKLPAIFFSRRCS